MIKKTPYLSIVIPIHNMKGGADFLWRSINAIAEQSFKDFEIIITKSVTGMAGNTNEGIKRARGELIKILYLDDYLAHEDALQDIAEQSFKDFEIIITKSVTGMAGNTNEGIKRARGELIKILYLDDYLAHEDALQDIVDNFTDDVNWLITSTDDNHNPYYTVDIETGNNKLGSPSALTIRNDNPLLFDENMSWLLDCDYYKRMFEKYGLPTIVKVYGRKANVIIGKGDHQMTHILTNEQKNLEANYLKEKYV